MSASVADMAARLEQRVARHNGAPASYHACVREAVGQYSQDAPAIRQVDLDIRPEVAAYDLPADFAKVIGLSTGAVVPADVLVSAGGLIPTPPRRPLRPAYTIVGGQIVFDPAPTYATVWALRYAAHYQEAAGVYPALDANGARIALLYAAYLALSEQAHSAAADGWSYTIGAESIDRSKMAGIARAEADAALDHYKEVLRRYQRHGRLGIGP